MSFASESAENRRPARRRPILLTLLGLLAVIASWAVASCAVPSAAGEGAVDTWTVQGLESPVDILVDR